MTDDPTYYKTSEDINILVDLKGFTADEVVTYITDETWPDPLYEGPNTDGWSSQPVGRATAEEQAAWSAAYTRLTEEVRRHDSVLAHAQAAWEHAQGIHMAALSDAWSDYRPVHEAIEQRNEEVDKLRQAAYENARQQEAQAAIDAQAEEDRRLGPRDWVVYHPSAMDAKAAPDMMVPTIHLAGCKLTHGREHSSYQTKYRFARKDEVEKALLEGGPEMSRGRNTGNRLHTKLCGRCKPETSLRTVLGDVFDTWLVEAESVQQSMPTERGMPKALGLENEWSTRYPLRGGYAVPNTPYYEVEPYEMLIGWVVTKPDGGRQFTDSAEEHLAKLVEVLPARGFAVRRLPVPKILDHKRAGQVSSTYVAVRRMTKYEKRQYKATGRVGDNQNDGNS